MSTSMKMERVTLYQGRPYKGAREAYASGPSKTLRKMTP